MWRTTSIKAVKYLFKYIYKGHDRASVSLDEPDSNGDIDEIKQFRDARWVTPLEALWRIYSKVSPPMMQLQLHLLNMHMVTFRAGQDMHDVVAQNGTERSMLTEYFKMNKTNEGARSILYRDFPAAFVWLACLKQWKKRDKHTQVG